MGKRNRRQYGEGSLFQRGDGRWVARVHLGYKADGNADRRDFYGRTPEEAQAARAKFMAQREQGFTPGKGRGDTVGDWLRHWLNSVAKEQVRETTWNRSYRPAVENHLIPGLGGRLRELEPAAIEALYARMRKDGLSPATISGVHRVLKRALKVAVLRGLVPRNVASLVSPTRSGDPVPEPMPPERHEATAILDAVRGRWNGARWGVALGAGVRQGEALGLLWPYVDISDLDRATVQVAWELVRLPWAHGCEDAHACGERLHRHPCPPDGCPKVRISGRPHVCHGPGHCDDHDGKRCPKWCDEDCTRHASSCPARTGGGHVLTPPKSTKSRRTIPIPRPLAEWLSEHRTWQEAERSAASGWTGWGHDPATCSRRPRAREVVCPACRLPVKADALVFAQRSGRPVDGRRDWQEWSDLLDELGIPHYRPHDARHFVGTTLLEEGADVVVVQEMLGHSTSAITQQVYQHVRAGLKRDAAERMNGALWSESRG